MSEGGKSGSEGVNGNGDDETALPMQSALSDETQSASSKDIQSLIDDEAGLTSKAAESMLIKVVEHREIETLRLLLEHFPHLDINKQPETDIFRPLASAAFGGSSDIVALLIHHGAEIDFVEGPAQNIRALTPLSIASYEGHLEVVKLLLEHNAGVNYTGDGTSYPAIVSALWSNHVHVAKYLLAYDNLDLSFVGDKDGMGVVHVAIHHATLVATLLEKGAPVDTESIFGTPLYMASRDAEPETLKTLLQHDPRPDIEYKYSGKADSQVEEEGFSPLQAAVWNSSWECVDILLEAGADPTFRNQQGDDVVDILIMMGPGSEESQELLTRLVYGSWGLSLKRVTASRQSRLHQISQTTHVSIVEIAVNAGTPLDARNDRGYTPLAVALRCSNLDVAKFLLKRGADPGVLGPEFGSLLHLAVRLGDLDMVKQLIFRGAKVEKVHADYGEPLLSEAMKCPDEAKLLKTIRYLVDEAKTPVNQAGGDFGYPIIMAARGVCKSNKMGVTYCRIMQFLIRRGADINVMDRQGRRAVHVACCLHAGWSEGLKILVEAGADVDVTDKIGRKLIHFAVSNGTTDCFDYLMEKFPGIMDCSARDIDGWNPLIWAARWGDSSLFSKLIEGGASVWDRGEAWGVEDDLSALRVLEFYDRWEEEWKLLVPTERQRTDENGYIEEWVDWQNAILAGHIKDASCSSCLVPVIRGSQWKCIDCYDDFSLCFKCVLHQQELHNPAHTFKKIGPTVSLWSDTDSDTERATRSAGKAEHQAEPDVVKEMVGQHRAEFALVRGHSDLDASSFGPDA